MYFSSEATVVQKLEAIAKNIVDYREIEDRQERPQLRERVYPSYSKINVHNYIDSVIDVPPIPGMTGEKAEKPVDIAVEEQPSESEIVKPQSLLKCDVHLEVADQSMIPKALSREHTRPVYSMFKRQSKQVLFELPPPAIQNSGHQRHRSIATITAPPPAATAIRFPNFYPGPSDMPTNPHIFRATGPPSQPQPNPLRRTQRRPKVLPQAQVGVAAEILPSQYVNIVDRVLDNKSPAPSEPPARTRGMFSRVKSLTAALVGSLDYAGGKIAGLLGITDGRYEEYYDECERWEIALEEKRDAQCVAVAAEELRRVHGRVVVGSPEFV